MRIPSAAESPIHTPGALWCPRCNVEHAPTPASAGEPIQRPLSVAGPGPRGFEKIARVTPRSVDLPRLLRVIAADLDIPMADDEREALNAHAAELAPPSPASCTWDEEDFETDLWQSDCGVMFCLNEGTPLMNDMKFCCGCGKPIIERRAE